MFMLKSSNDAVLKPENVTTEKKNEPGGKIIGIIIID